MPELKASANVARARVGSAIEHLIAHQKGPMNLRVCTIGIDRARTKIDMVNLVFNMCRFVWLERSPAPA
jgi:hypothetical protein